MSEEASEPEAEVVNVETILTVAILGHGIEEVDPFPESSPIGEFYKKRTRVFSQARVPDMTCIMADEDNAQLLEVMITNLRDNPTNETKVILESYMDVCKPNYMEFLKPENLMDEYLEDKTLARTFKQKYRKKTCGTMVYLNNKVFEFGSDFLEGIYLIDVRLKKTYSDGAVEYESIFTPDPDKPLILTSFKGLDFFWKVILKNSKALKEFIDRVLITNGECFKKTDLIQLYDLFKVFNYVNILDYTCRSSFKRLTGRKIAYMYDQEQEAADELPNFGGKRKDKTKSKSKHKSKTRRRTKKTRKTTRRR